MRILIIFLLLLTSCGAKKTDIHTYKKSSSVEKIQEKETDRKTIEREESEKTELSIIEEFESDEINIVYPNGKKVNIINPRKRTEANTINEKKESNKVGEENEKVREELKEDVLEANKVKKTERKPFDLWYLFPVTGALIVAWLFWRWLKR